ncbi:hypothetical protein JTB14_036745 [Gonioctena quinquepunctata]|nr:hypothetical protein JTB14_036745 [Gonioctena quinquepunctata]
MKTFLDIFSCLICLGDILGNGTNLVQCVNGHTICEECSIRCRICPVCRVPYDAGVIRNLLMEEMRDVLIRYFGIPQEETPINSDADLPLTGNDDDSDSTVILNMDEHMQRMEDDYIETPASPASEDFFDPAGIFRNGHQHPFESSPSPSPDLFEEIHDDGEIPNWMPPPEIAVSPEGIAGVGEDDIIEID